MQEVILRHHFPRGTLPVRGFRCAVCGEEKLTGDDVARLQATARALGLYGLENARVRKLVRTGGSLAVTLDPGLLREVLGQAKPGSPVRVGLQGRQIVVEAV